MHIFKKNFYHKIMGSILTVVLILSILLVTPEYNVANALISGEYEYLITENGEVHINKYTGSSSDIQIPKTIDGKPVTNVGGFKNNNILNSVVLPEGVTTIENEGFKDCANLKKVVLPNTIKSINDNAFYLCNKLYDISIPDGVKAIGRSALNGTPFLNNRTEDFVILGDGVLVKYNGTNKNVSIPNGVKFISSAFMYCDIVDNVVMPDTVVTVDSNAFSNSTLRSITISDNLISIGTMAFYKTNLEKVKIPGKVKEIGDFAFSNSLYLTSVDLENNSTTVGNHMFSNCYALTEVLLADSITIIDTYAFYNCQNIKALNLPKNLKMINSNAFELCTGLEKIEIPEGITSIKDFVFKSCYALKTVKLSDNILSIGWSAFSSCINLESCLYLGNLKSISNYAFSSCSKLTVLAVSDNLTSIGKEAFTGCTNLTIYGTKNSAIQKYLEKNFPEISFESYGLKMDGLSITIPANIPFLGGEQLEMDFDRIPLMLKIKGNTIRATIGDADCKTDADWTNLKRSVTNASQRLPNTHNESSTSKYGVAKTFGTQFDISVFGYAEATFKDRNIAYMQDLNGSLVIQMSAKLSRQWQTLFFSVPIVIKCSGEVSISQGAVLGYDLTQNELYMRGETELVLPKIRASAGVGVAYLADVSVYGQASNTLTIKELSGHAKAALSGELGVSASLLNFTYELPLLNGTWEYYNSENQNSMTQNKLQNLQSPSGFKIDRSYLQNRSEWLGNKPSLLRSTASSSERTLRTDIYPSASPKLVSTPNGTIMMVWTSDVANRTDGNHTAVVYSLYSKLFDAWSEPQIIANDGTADFYPDVVAIGNDIYVAWVNVNKVVPSDISITDMAKSCEIAVAKFDSEEQEFEKAVRLTNNSTLDVMPSLAAVNGQPYAAWVNNSNSDLFAQSGTNTVYYAQLSNLSSVSPQIYAASGTPVVSMDIGSLGGALNLVYAKDADSDLSTTNDIELYGGPAGDSPARITSNDAFEQNPQFATVAGTDLLLWYSGNNLYKTGNLTESTKLFEDGDLTLSPNYSVVSGGGNDAIVCVSDSEEGRDAYACLLDGASWSKPVPVTSSGEYVKYANGYFDKNNNLNIAYTKTSAQVGDSSITQKTDLCVSTIPKSHNLAVGQAQYDESSATLGGTLPIDIPVANNGMLDENGFQISVMNGETEYYTAAVQQQLAVGESGIIHIDLPLANSYNALTNYTVKVLPASGTDSGLTDNTCTVSVGHPDLQILLNESDTLNGSNITATVVNNGLSYTYGKLYIRKGSPNGETLKEYNIEPVGVGGSTSRTIIAKELSALASDGDMLYFVVASDKPEISTGDNNDFIAANIKYILGDVDNDGSVSTADTLMIQKYQSSIIVLDDFQKQAADVNQDGSVGTADVLLLQKFLAGQLSDTQIGKEQSYIKK